jgi:hypothetical protein
MGMMRRRMRRRAIVGTAVVAGGAAYVGNRAGKASAQQQMAQEAPPEPAYQEPAPAPAMSAGDSQIDELQKLASLKDQGILTEEEFSAKKAQILGI